MASERRYTEPPLKYDAFWHLQAIGLLEPTDPEQPLLPSMDRKATGTWESLAKAPGALVAMIDTGVSMHPYLTGRLRKPEPGPNGLIDGALGAAANQADEHINFDLTAAPSSLARGGQPPKIAAITDDWLEDLGLFTKSAPKPHQIALKKIVDDNIGRIAFDTGAPATSNRQFSAHGTSCAGILAASSEYDPNKTLNRPYYRGVDPKSEILSITTSFSPRPDLLTMAFLLAARKDADVILFPRGLPREILDADDKLPPKWRALKETIIAVSKRIPVVCAAGNDSNKELIAPALFAKEDNGIIGVAAMNYFAWRSSYSNFGEGITVAGPSDDAEIFNEDQARFDKTDRFHVDYPYDHYVANLYPDIQRVPFGEASIRSIDVPGAFGFSDASTNGSAKLSADPESYFADFGGTSAAAAIVAGVASLMQRAAKSKPGGRALNGKETKKYLKDSARTSAFPHLKLTSHSADALQLDRVDGGLLTQKLAFGAGLVAADRAVNLVLTGDPNPRIG